MRAPAILAATAALSACAGTANHTTDATPLRAVEGDAETRAALLGALAALEGEWQLEVPAGQEAPIAEYRVSSAGHVVREIMMRGTGNEMTNLYQLDGNGVTMWHFCALGNTPRMHAAGLVDGRLAFEFADVTDLNAEDDPYMGSMTLEWVDADTIEQHWSTLTSGEVDHEMTMRWTRL